MAERKDYYKILGVSKDASEADIKKAYKELSKKWHPDRCRDASKKDEYTAKFQEINEAHSVLSDKDKRAQYDNPMNRFGGNPFGGGGNPFDFVNQFMGGGFGGFNPFGGAARRQKTVQKGSNVHLKVNVTLEELYNGGTKEVSYTIKDKCTHCGGSGKTAQTVEESCPYCGGTGMHYTTNGNFQQITTCPYCKGQGKTVKNPCPHCNGDGIEPTNKTLSITVPKGAEENVQFIVEGGGYAAPHGDGIYGDLVVTFHTMKHDYFTRNGSNLEYELHINVIDAILGCSVEVPTIDGKKLSTKIKQGVLDGTKLRFRGKGLPLQGQEHSFGDMYATIKIDMPQELNQEEIDILQALKSKPHFQ